MANQGSRYNEEFKADILRLIREESQPVNKVTNDFEINDKTIRNWLKAAEEKKAPENSCIAELEAMIRKEKKKIADL